MAKIHPTADIAPSAQIGDGCTIWQNCIVMAECTIGNGTKLGHNVFVEQGVRVGERCTIKDNVCLYEGIEIDDDVFVGPNAVFTNVRNPRAAWPDRTQFEKICLGRGCTIGANATIVCGHDVGAYAFIGAGTVVVANVPAYALMVGNPGRQIGWVGRAGVPLDDALICPKTGERYLLDDDNHLAILVQGR